MSIFCMFDTVLHAKVENEHDLVFSLKEHTV